MIPTNDCKKWECHERFSYWFKRLCRVRFFTFCFIVKIWLMMRDDMTVLLMQVKVVKIDNSNIWGKYKILLQFLPVFIYSTNGISNNFKPPWSRCQKLLYVQDPLKKINMADYENTVFSSIILPEKCEK